MTKLRISDTLALPLDFVTLTQVILAKKGSGKSYTASVEAEEMLTAGQQIVVVDPTGAWWGLRSSADGKSSGFPIAVLGGEHGDVPLEPLAGEVIADAIATEHFSCVLDLSLFRKAEGNRFMGVFLETLYRRNRSAMHLFVDEADVYAPQRPFGDEARTLGACEDIVRRGRIRGIGCTLITQRPQVLNKNVLSQADVLTALRMNHPKDLAALKEWVEVHAELGQAKLMIDSLPALPIGEAWIWAPATNVFERVKVRRRTTFDSGKTPKAGERVVAPKVLAPVDIARLGSAIAATVERVKATDPRALKARVVELERLLAAKPGTAAERLVEVKVPVLTEADIKRLEATAASLEAVAGTLYDELENIGEMTQAIEAAINLSKQLPPRSPAPRPAPQGRAIVHRDVKPANVITSAPSGGLPPARQKVLDVLALFERLDIESSRDTLAAWYGCHPNSKSYVNILGELRSQGLVDGFALTDAGRAAANRIEPPTQDEAREMIMGPLEPARRRILDVLIAAHPQGCTRDELAETIGMHPNSKSLVNNLGALRTRQLVTQGWPVKAGAVLFMDGAS